VKRSLKIIDNKLANQRSKLLRQRFVKPNTKAGTLLFETFATHALKAVGSAMKPRSYRQRLAAINQMESHFANTYQPAPK